MSISIHSSSHAADLGVRDLQRLAKDPNVSERDKVVEVARQFESILLRQYLGEARKTLVMSKYNLDSGSSDIYRDMATSQLADHISGSRMLGLGSALEAQLLKQAQVDKPSGTASGDVDLKKGTILE